MMHIPDKFNYNEDFSDILKQFDEMLTLERAKYFDVEIFTEIINYLIDTNQKEKAKQALKIGLKQHPNAEELILKDAQFSIITQNFKRAKNILKDLLNTNKADAEIYYYLGKLQLATDKLNKAIRYFDSALTLAEIDEKISLLYMITDDLMDKGEYHSAVNYLHQVLEIDQYDFEALIDLGTCYKELNQISHAIEEFDKYLDRDPFNEMIWHQLGNLYEYKNDTKMALDAYEFAAAIEPEYASAYFSIALIYSRDEQYDKAINYLEELISHEGKNLHAYFYLAESYYQTGQKDQAMLNFEKTLSLDPDFADAWFGIGEIYYDENKITESLVYVRKAIKIDPEEPLCWLRLATIQQSMKYLTYALKSYKKVIKLDPFDEKARVHLAECHFELKEYQETIELCETALETFRDPAFYYLWGAALVEKEELTDGLNKIESGLKKDKEAFNNFVYFYPKILSFDAVKKLVNLYEGL